MRCQNCLRLTDWGDRRIGQETQRLYCTGCSKPGASCTCEWIDLTIEHPYLKQTPLQVGDIIHVKGRALVDGGPTAGGVVTGIRVVLHQQEVWIELNGSSEIFLERHLARGPHPGRPKR